MKTLIKITFFALSILANLKVIAHTQNTDSLTFSTTNITIASEPNYPPFCFVNSHGEAEGFSVELFRAATTAVGLNVAIKNGAWDQIMHDLENGNIDALPLVGKTPEREVIFDFTVPYLRLHGAIFVKQDNKQITTFYQLKDKTIAVMEGSSAEAYVRSKNITLNIITTTSFAEAFALLNSNEVDAVIAQQVMGIELLKSMAIDEIIPLDVLLNDFQQSLCFAVKKGNTQLLGQLNEGLSLVIANGTYNELYFKWFGPKFKEEISFRDYINIAVKLLIPITMFLSLVLIIVLRRMVHLRTKELKQEIDEHQKTNQLLEKMESTSKVGGWAQDVESKKVSWTKGVYSIYGVSPQDFDPSAFDTYINFYRPNDKELLELAFQQLLKTGKSFDFELRLTDSSGIEKWVRNSGQAEYQNGKIVRTFGSIMDISKNKIAELAVIENETRVREIFNSTNEAIIVHEASTGKILDCNESTLRIYGYSTKRELLNKNVGDISLNEYPYTQAEAIKMITKAINEGSHTFEWVCRKRNGSTFWCEVSLRYTELSNKKSVLAVVRDTSERKEIEAKLQEQKQIFNHLMENNPIYVFFKDENIRAIMLSKNYEQLLNRPLNEILGKPMDEIFPSDLAKSMIEDDKKILKEGKTIVVDEKLNDRFYTTIKFPIIINGKPRYLAGYTIDITDRKKTEQELLSVKNNLEKIVEERTKELEEQVQKLDKSQKAMLYMIEDLNAVTEDLKKEREKLQISNKELESFSYSVSHDLRAPLRAIDGFSSILEQEYAAHFDEEGLRILGIIRENSKKMDRLITDLLSLSRVTRNEMNYSPINMASMAKAMFYEVADKKDTTDVELIINPLHEIHADSALMRQVWQNLIGNALKYSRPKPNRRIEIGCEIEANSSNFFIKDNGVGFNPTYAHKIFDTFQRLHKSEDFEGTGIGLSIVQRIISRHGGKVWAESKEGEGSVFWFSIPKNS